MKMNESHTIMKESTSTNGPPKLMSGNARACDKLPTQEMNSRIMERPDRTELWSLQMGSGKMDIKIEEMTNSDWPAVEAIYREGIESGDATFETKTPSWERFDTGHLHEGRLVAKSGDTLVGWVALTPVSSRCVYRGVAEISIYIKASARGQGVGKALLKAAIDRSERVGLWTLQAGIFPENMSSLALHRNCGFRMVGYRERIGQMNGHWRDVVLMERRSTVVGKPNDN